MRFKLKENELLVRACFCENCGHIFRWDEAKWDSPTGDIMDLRIKCPRCGSYFIKEFLLENEEKLKRLKEK